MDAIDVQNIRNGVIIRRNVTLLIIISICLLSVYGFFNVIAYLYTFVIFNIGNQLFPKELRYSNIISFEFYLLIGILIFTIQYLSLPSYQGLSGPEGGIGTDDIRYYEKITDIPLRVSSTAGWIEAFPFSDFLRFIYPFKIVSPLNVVIVNLLGIAYLPGLTYILTQSFVNNRKIATNARIFTLLCPSLWSNGLIIMRDVWTVSLTVLIFILIFKRQYVISILPLILLCYLRFGSVAFVFIGMIIILKYQIFSVTKFRKFCFWMIIFFVILIFCTFLSKLVEITDGKFEGSFFRTSFISMLINNDEDGVITKIAQMDPLIRTPLLFLFFYFAPFIKFKAYTLGVFNIRTILDTILTASWFLILSRYIFRFIYTSFVSKSNIKVLTWISIYLALALSIISLQVRHKVIMMPFFAIMAAIGISEKKTRYNQVFILLSVFIAILEVLFALR